MVEDAYTQGYHWYGYIAMEEDVEMDIILSVLVLLDSKAVELQCNLYSETTQGK